MSYKRDENKLSLYIDNCEAGYIRFNNVEDGLEISQTYVYPGFRENGYAQKLVEHMVNNYDNEVKKVTCSYYRIMSQDYKLSLVG